jgi:GNAT superfamily N-acetyltransferase
LQFDNGDLDGVWTGYDHINKRTTTGRYSFKRLRRVRIKRYQAQHRAAVLDILAATFGQGYLSDVDKAAAEDKSITYVALDGRRVCAFGYAYLASAGALANIARGLDPRFTPALRDADGKGTLGVIQTLAVEPSVQGRGVGTQMLTSLEEYLWRQEATAIIVPAWQRQTGVTVAGLLKASGYVAWGSALQYWRAACDRDEFQCPDRGSTCVCDAVFYRKTLAR